MELVAEGENALLGAALLLVAAGAAKGCVELILVEGGEQRLRLHEVGVHLGAVGKGAHASFESLFVALHNQLPAMLAGIPVAELEHLLELPLGVDVHEGEGRTARGKCLLGQAHHHT